MRYWIEVTGDYQWELRLKGKLGLNAPNTRRYANFFKEIDKGDIILHHITTQRALKDDHKSSIVGISKAKSKMYEDGNKLLVDLKDSSEFFSPIAFDDYSKIETPSVKFQYLLHLNLQRYIIEIEKEDVKKIIQLKKENKSLLNKYNL